MAEPLAGPEGQTDNVQIAEQFTLADSNLLHPPAPPPAVQASDGASQDGIQLTWAVGQAATGYEIWRSTTDDPSTASRISDTDVAGTSFDDSSAVAGTIYWYRVKASNSAGDSPLSTASDSGYRLSSGAAPVGVPGTPADDVITAVASGNELVINNNGRSASYLLWDVSALSLDGGDGNDSIAVDASVPFGVLIRGGAGNDLLSGGSGTDNLYGQGGADTLNGGGGNDRLAGGSSDDWLRGGAGSDTLVGNPGGDLLVGNAGDDSLLGNTGDDTLRGAGGADTLRGGGGIDIFQGGAGDDWLLASDGLPDVLSGGGGGDWLTGDRDIDQLLTQDIEWPRWVP